MAELSAPVVIDDSPAILPSKLLGETTRSNRDPTPDREDAEPQLSKLPAYHRYCASSSHSWDILVRYDL